MMDPKENDIKSNFFILPDSWKEYLKQCFTKILKQIWKPKP